MPEQPLTGYHFQVEWGDSRIGFTEVSGLDIEVDVIEYREGASPVQSPLKLPGLVRYPNIVLKRGIVAGDNGFFEWLDTIRMGRAERRDLVVSLLDENHEPVVRWKARNAFPVRLEGPVLRAEGSTVAIETLEVAHEGLTVENG
jgi:phage tail-like protein